MLLVFQKAQKLMQVQEVLPMANAIYDCFNLFFELLDKVDKFKDTDTKVPLLAPTHQ